MRKDYMFLKSGTDVRGVALEGVEGQNVVLTDEVVYDIVCAFVKWVSKLTFASFRKDNFMTYPHTAVEKSSFFNMDKKSTS